MQSNRVRTAMDTFLLVLALTLLIAGFPSALFGVFLTISEQDGIEGGAAFWFSLSLIHI